MPTLAQLVTDEATATLGEGDAALHIDYRPRRAATPAMMRLVRDLQRMNRGELDTDALIDTFERLKQFLCDVIVRWDLLEDDGATVVPLTSERLERIDIVTQTAVLMTVMEAAQASLGESNGMRSPRPTAATSGPVAPSTSSRTKGASRKR